MFGAVAWFDSDGYRLLWHTSRTVSSQRSGAWVDREVVCFVVAAALVSGGTLATGVLPQELLFQVAAGTVIVAGFVVIVLCLRDEPAG